MFRLQKVKNAVTEVAAKIIDSPVDGVQRAIRRYAEGMNSAALVARLQAFEGNCIAELCHHLSQINFSAEHAGHGPLATLDDVERRGGGLYSGKGSKHEFNRR